jgi:DNA repair protein RecO (recombination protein O)
MPREAESATILVLRKTKLGETDLIITGFSDEGRQVRAVAKGARRPGSRTGVHLELYSVARVLLHKGRSLDIVTEAEGLSGNERCRGDLLHSAAAAVVVELLDKVSMDGDTEPRLFPLALEALRCVGTVPDEGVALIAAATVLKTASQLGFRPSLRECVCCGAPLPTVGDGAVTAAGAAAGASGVGGAGADRTGGVTAGAGAGSAGAGGASGTPVTFSFAQGGHVCDACLPEVAAGTPRQLDASLVAWAEVLITSRFIELERYATPEHESLGYVLLEFAREWLRAHLVPRLKSLDFLLTLPN